MALKAELERINEIGWQASEGELIAWTNTEGYPADAAIEGGEYNKIAENTEYNTESLAKFAFSMFYQAAKFSLENRVLIIMDY